MLRVVPFPGHRILTRDMVESPSGARGSDPSARSPPPQPPPPNAVLAAAGVEPHPEPTSAFGANEVYDVLGSDDVAMKAELEAATAALRADLKATSDRLAELETGAALQELDGMQGELAKKIRAWREEMYGGTMEALSELEALKLAIEKGGSLDTDVVRMVEELAATRLEVNEFGAVHPPEVAAALASIGDTDTIEGVESWVEGLAARIVDAHGAEPPPALTPASYDTDDTEDIDDMAEIDARIAAMEARLEEAKASRDEALRLRARVESEAAEFVSMLAEDGAADPRGGVATDAARKVLEAVGGGAELDELRRILEEDAGG